MSKIATRLLGPQVERYRPAQIVIMTDYITPISFLFLYKMLQRADLRRVRSSRNDPLVVSVLNREIKRSKAKNCINETQLTKY